MKIFSARLGELEIDAANIVTFADGIIGFPDYKRYTELDFLEGSPIKLFQAVDKPELAFFIIDPDLFVKNYLVDISAADTESINAKGLEEIAIRAIVSIPENPYEMTANLKGPLIININTRLAKQVVNNSQSYSTKHKILVNPELSAVEK